MGTCVWDLKCSSFGPPFPKTKSNISRLVSLVKSTVRASYAWHGSGYRNSDPDIFPHVLELQYKTALFAQTLKVILMQTPVPSRLERTKQSFGKAILWLFANLCGKLCCSDFPLFFKCKSNLSLFFPDVQEVVRRRKFLLLRGRETRWGGKSLN